MKQMKFLGFAILLIILTGCGKSTKKNDVIQREMKQQRSPVGKQFMKMGIQFSIREIGI